MNNEQFVKKFGKQYLTLLEKAETMHYTVNEVQFEKLINLCNFFQDYIKENGGKAEPINLNPAEIHSGLTVEFVLFNIIGNEIQEFCEAIKGTTALSIDTTTDGKVCISMTVPDIFVRV